MIKKICILLSALFVLLTMNITAFAATSEKDEEDFNTRHSNISIPWVYNTKDGHRYHKGGVNTFDGVDCKSEEDTKQLEALLRRSGYVLVNTDQKEISDEDYDLLYNNTVYTAHGRTSFEEPYYANSESAETHVYYERHILNEILRRLKNDDLITTPIKSEAATSTVLVDYSVWVYEKRAYTITNHFNNNVPSYYTNTGFLLIKSPINARVLLQDKFEFTRSELFVKGGEPLLIKVPTGDYTVISVNDKEKLGVWEDSIIHYNQVAMYPEHTEEEPNVLDLEGVVAKYNIQPIDLSDTPDHSWENRDDDDYQPWLPTESTVITDPNIPQPTNDNQTLWRIIFIGLAVVVVIAIIIILNRLKKKYREG